jgi:voltage-dependent calcium channel alpha-2/delta-3
MTDWLWEMKECAEQKERFESYRRDKEKFDSKEEQDKRFAKKLRRVSANITICKILYFNA